MLIKKQTKPFFFQLSALWVAPFGESGWLLSSSIFFCLFSLCFIVCNFLLFDWLFIQFCHLFFFWEKGLSYLICFLSQKRNNKTETFSATLAALCVHSGAWSEMLILACLQAHSEKANMQLFSRYNVCYPHNLGIACLLSSTVNKIQLKLMKCFAGVWS